MFWTLPRKGRRTKTQTVMNKKIYNTPYVEQTECLGLYNLCEGSGDNSPASPEDQNGDPAPGGMAPRRRVF